MHMKKLSFLLLASLFAAGMFIGCSSGTEVKVSSDTTKMASDTVKVMSDTTPIKDKPIVPPPQ